MCLWIETLRSVIIHGTDSVWMQVLCKFEDVFCCVLTNVAALNSQSSFGSGPGSPAAVGSLGAASLALSSPLYPAGPSLLAADPHHTSSSLLSHGPDTQQTRLVLTGSNQLISHVDVLECSSRATLTA